MHEAADDEATDGTAGQVQSGTLLHAGVAHETPLGEEVGGQLDRGAETGADHGGTDAAVETAQALAAVDLRQTVDGVAVLVLGTDGERGREALEARLDEEEGGAGGGTNDAGAGAAKHVDGQRLDRVGAVEGARDAAAHGLVEAQAAPVEHHLVDVGAAETAVDGAHALVAQDDAHAVQRAAVVQRLVALELQLALQLHAVHAVSRCLSKPAVASRVKGALPNLDRLKGMRGRDGTAGREATANKGPVSLSVPAYSS